MDRMHIICEGMPFIGKEVESLWLLACTFGIADSSISFPFERLFQAAISRGSSKVAKSDFVTSLNLRMSRPNSVVSFLR